MHLASMKLLGQASKLRTHGRLGAVLKCGRQLASGLLLLGTRSFSLKDINSMDVAHPHGGMQSALLKLIYLNVNMEKTLG